MLTDQPQSPFFRAWARVVLRLRWLMLALTLLLTVGAVYQVATQLRFDNSAEYFASGDQALADTLEQYRDDFGRDELYFLLISGDVFSPDFLERLRALHQELEGFDMELPSRGQRKADRDKLRGWVRAPPAAPSPSHETPASADDAGFGDDFGSFGDASDADAWGDEAGGTLVEQVSSLINARQTVFEGGAIRVRGLLDRWPSPQELPALKRQVLSDPVLVGTVVGREGKHAVLSVRTDFVDETDSQRINAALLTLAKRHEAPGFSVQMAGLPSINATLDRRVQYDTQRLTGLSFLVMSLVLGWIYRRPLAVFASLGVVGLAAIWTLGAMAFTDTPVTLLTNIVPAFLACVGMGDSVHVQSIFHDARARGQTVHDAVITAVGSTGVPVLFTSLTTMAGLLSFRFATTVAIQEMGLAAAFGVLAALLHSLVFLPVMLSLMGGEATTTTQAERPPDLIDAFLTRLTRLSDLRPGRVLLFSGALTGILLVGCGMLRVYHNPLTWLGDDDPTVQAVHTMDAAVGGTATVNVLIEANSERGLRDRELLLAMQDFDQRVQRYIHPVSGQHLVTGTISLLDILRETNRALHQGDATYYTLPSTQRGVSDALLLFENAGPDELSRLATTDLRRTHLTIRLHWTDATAYQPFTAFLSQTVRDSGLDQHATVQLTGTTYSLVSVVGRLISDMLRSFGVAVLVISVLMIALLRDVKLGLISMVPNLMPIALVMGFMGFVGIPLDLSNLLIASIIIGIAVDDTIHYLHQVKRGLAAGLDIDAAIQHALDHAGRAMVSTSLILALGFGVFVASSMVSILRFGLLIGLTCLGALVIDIAITPALLRYLYRKPRS